MEYVVVCVVALVASGLTLFSGFGLGTLLLPAFALFFPLPVAIAATAVVHLANNVFKVGLVGRHAVARVVLRFGVPAAAAAVVGALLLSLASQLPVLTTYQLGSTVHEVALINLVVGLLLVAFALLELLPAVDRLEFDARWLPVGGALSGFLGGLSGMQGALRSAFLVRAGLDPQQFVGTGTVCAVLVDVSRLLVYGLAAVSLSAVAEGGATSLVVAAALSAFLGAYVGKRVLGKTTLPEVQRIVAIALIIFGLGIASGLL